MKCPKCEYLGFELSDRCRNCGYEFSLTTIPEAELPPLDLRPPLDLDRIIGGAPEDLPLFTAPPATGDDGQPLIAMPSKPRAPLGVRRATPEIPRARVRTPRPAEATLFANAPAAFQARSADALMSANGNVASPGRRIIAALVDGFLLTGVDAAVLYFTLRLCDLTLEQIFKLPVIPLAAFFVLLNGGYLVAFTAVGGQSIGKMALGIKVVAEEDRPVPFGRAALRTLAYAASALPLGAGFLAGLLGADRLAFHDRLTHTRVVRPSA